MIKVVIIDDERYCVELLVDFITDISKRLVIVATFLDSEKALAFLQSNKDIDLVFLDLKMPKLNGFELLDKVEKINFDIIFTTAYNDHAIRAFQFSAINYLLKPIQKKDIISTLELWRKRKNKTYPEQWEILKSTIKNKRNIQTQKIALPIRNDFNLTKVDEIIRCQADSNYTDFYFINDKRVTVSKTLKDVEDLLKEYNFIRVHQSHLVNLNKVKNFQNREGNSLVVLNNQTEIPVSRQKRKMVKDLIKSYGIT